MPAKKSARHYGEIAQAQLLQLYQDLPEDGRSWAAVAVAIGLEPRDKAAVNAVARKASAQRKVLVALGLPGDFTAVLACRCGCGEAAHCKRGRELVRRDKAQASGLALELAGELTYKTADGELVTVDLSQRARRLGTTAQTIEAADLFDLFCGDNLPAFMEA